jgi:hypothetical protein
MKPILAIGIVFVSSIACFAQQKSEADPPELAARRDDHDRNVQRAMVPLLTNYLRSLEPLKQQYTRAGKLEAAVAVDGEIRKVTEQLKTAQAIASGAKRGPKGYVQFFTEQNFKGKSLRLEAPGEYPELMNVGIPNDSIRSMKIPPGFTVTVFDSNLMKGTGQPFTGDVGTLGDLNSMASSLRITPTKDQ